MSKSAGGSRRDRVFMPETVARKSDGTDRPIGWAHAVLKVRDLLRSELFYTEVIGFRVIGRRTGMTFLSLGGPHHDLALYEAGPRAQMPGTGSLGVVHLAFAMEDESALRRFYAFLKGKVEILGAVDHIVSRSFYISDPEIGRASCR